MGATLFVFGLLADGLASSADLCCLAAVTGGSRLKFDMTALTQSIDSWSSFVSSSLVGGCYSTFHSSYVPYTLPSTGLEFGIFPLRLLTAVLWLQGLDPAASSTTTFMKLGLASASLLVLAFSPGPSFAPVLMLVAFRLVPNAALFWEQLPPALL